jgi:SPP1 family predicted phage head-tail adaptor
MDIGKLRDRISIEQKQVARDPVYGSEQVTWVEVARVWGDAEDLIGKGRESVSQSLKLSTQPVRVVIRFRNDLTTDMRCKVTNRGDRLLLIRSIAELGVREGSELICENLTV